MRCKEFEKKMFRAIVKPESMGLTNTQKFEVYEKQRH
jgi:hypothetical protein